jgi:hypothetical protein
LHNEGIFKEMTTLNTYRQSDIKRYKYVFTLDFQTI